LTAILPAANAGVARVHGVRAAAIPRVARLPGAWLARVRRC